MTVPDESRSRRLTVGLLVALVLVLALGGWLMFVRLTGPQTIQLVISAPPGANVYYDLVLDGSASSGVATVPATLTFHGQQFAFAVIPKDATATDLSVELQTPQGGGSSRGQGVTGTYHHSSVSSQSSIRPMTATHVANMRRARQAEEAKAEE